MTGWVLKALNQQAECLGPSGLLLSVQNSVLCFPTLILCSIQGTPPDLETCCFWEHKLLGGGVLAKLYEDNIISKPLSMQRKEPSKLKAAQKWTTDP
jgi:hypothetical protein